MPEHDSTTVTMVNEEIILTCIESNYLSFTRVNGQRTVWVRRRSTGPLTSHNTLTGEVFCTVEAEEISGYNTDH